MEYDEEDYSFGDEPECGAIFMSSTLTMEECFKRHVFALPSSKARFVKHIKAGMLLFLFDFKKRQLYGVFKATSDGAMDIVPGGFYCSGRHFPAQVCFRTLWHCHPLNEKEFEHAIYENYFSAKKFKFGLTEVQVGRLLNLFSSRKTKKNLSPCRQHPPREDNYQTFASNDRVELSERPFIEYDDHSPSALCDYQTDLMIRAKEEAIMSDDVVNGEGKIYRRAQDFLINYRDNFLPRRRHSDCDAVLLKNDERENEKYGNHIMSRPLCTGSSNNHLEARKLADGRFSPTIDRAYDESLPLMGRYAVDPLEARGTQYGRSMHRNRLYSDSYMDDGFDQPYAKRVSKSYHTNDDRAVLHDNFAREYVSLDHFKPIVPTRHNSELLAEALHMPDDLMNGSLQSRYPARNDNVPVRASEEFNDHLPRTRTVARIFPNTEDVEVAYNRFTSVNGSSSESFLRQLECESRVLHDRKFRIAEGRVAENTVDSIRYSTTSIMDTGHIATDCRGDFGDERFRSSNGVDNAKDGHAFVCPAMSKYSLYSQQKKAFISDRPSLETRSSRLSMFQNNNSSHSAFDDDDARGWSAPAATDWKYSLGQNTHLYHGSVGNSYPLSKSSALPLLSHKSRRSISDDLEGGMGSMQANALTHQSSLPCRSRTTDSHLNSNLSMHRAPNITCPVNCGDSMPSRLSLHSMSPTSSIIHGEKGLAVAYPRKSSESPFGYNDHLQVATEYVPDHCSHMGVKGFSASAAHPTRDLSSYDNQDTRIAVNDYIKEHRRVSETPQSDPSSIIRRSIFTRLNTGQNVGVVQDSSSAHLNSDCEHTDASTVEVSEKLQQCINQRLQRLKDSEVLQPKFVNNDLHKNQIPSHIHLGHSTVEEKETAEGTGQVLKETRMVGFRRRSEKMKGVVENRTYPVVKNDIAISESNVESPTRKILKSEDEVERPPKIVLKRKRLVRPDFGKAQPALKHTTSAAVQLSEITHVDDNEQSSVRSICISDGEVLNVNSCSSNVLPLLGHESLDGKKNVPCCSNDEKDILCHVLPSSRDDIEKGHTTSSMEDIQAGTLRILHDETTQSRTCGLENTTGLLSEEVDLTKESCKQEEHSLEKPKLDSSFDSRTDGRKVKTVVEVDEKIVRPHEAVQEKGEDLEKDEEICETTVGMAEVCSLKNCEKKVDQEKVVVKRRKVVRGQGHDPEKEIETCETSQGKNKSLFIARAMPREISGHTAVDY